MGFHELCSRGNKQHFAEPSNLWQSCLEHFRNALPSKSSKWFDWLKCIRNALATAMNMELRVESGGEVGVDERA